MPPDLLISIIVIALVIIFFAPIRVFKSPFGGSRLTTIEWLGTIGKKNKQRISEAIKARDAARELFQKIESQSQPAGLNPDRDPSTDLESSDAEDLSSQDNTK